MIQKQKQKNVECFSLRLSVFLHEMDNNSS
jgi:hypothetical protein